MRATKIQNSYKNKETKLQGKYSGVVSMAMKLLHIVYVTYCMWDIVVGSGKALKNSFFGDYFPKQPTHHSVTAKDAYKLFKNFTSSRSSLTMTKRQHYSLMFFYDSDFFSWRRTKTVPNVSAVSISVSLFPSVSPALSVSPSRSASITASPTVLITTSTKYPAENTSSLIRDSGIFSIQKHCFLSDAELPNENHYKVSDWFIGAGSPWNFP